MFVLTLFFCGTSPTLFLRHRLFICRHQNQFNTYSTLVFLITRLCLGSNMREVSFAPRTSTCMGLFEMVFPLHTMSFSSINFFQLFSARQLNHTQTGRQTKIFAFRQSKKDIFKAKISKSHCNESLCLNRVERAAHTPSVAGVHACWGNKCYHLVPELHAIHFAASRQKKRSQHIEHGRTQKRTETSGPQKHIGWCGDVLCYPLAHPG